MWLGIDTGGTFTDFLLFDGEQLRVHKVLSTPATPEVAIIQGIEDLGLTDRSRLEKLVIVHGSTVATNAVLEGKGVRTVYITNHGLADLLTIGRQNRAELYNLSPQPRSAPVPHELCLEVGGRLAADGSVVEVLTDAELERLHQQLRVLKPESVAINLLFSFVDDQFERRVEAVIPDGIFISRSSRILPEYREYERGLATWLNAWVGPLMQRYLSRLKGALDVATLSVMQSSGGTIDIDQAANRAVHLLLSGPAGGLAAAKFIGEQTGCRRMLTFDMGGTSTDVALIDGDIALTNEGRIGPYPVAVPMVDMHTIGAGGGSIASVDEGGMLQVGPASAGAEPGPVCYGNGGREITVSDANLILGRLLPDAFLGGGMRLDVPAAEREMDLLASRMETSRTAAAKGVIDVANEHMARALRVMSVQRGVDPRSLTLTSFGGAGGLHVCALAESLGMDRAMVPLHSGVLSALGMLVAPKQRGLSRTLNQLLPEITPSAVEQLYNEMAEDGRADLIAEGVLDEQIRVSYSADLRYHGQNAYLNTPWGSREQLAEQFHQLHLQRLGHVLELPIEVVNLRVKVGCDVDRPQFPQPDLSPPSTHVVNDAGVALWQRGQLSVDQVIQGPALISDPVSTTYLAAGWCCYKDHFGHLWLQCKE
ncbi:MAG: hydantoinase/oxoprolinase family protein [Gammaproteobacteria bacterium]|nr:hydantoinase/oxoprolinase family protein [Gammaproteobacteria bacterium]MCF6229366.1 hydantoinase/oxoprolinase family protein [Gammaproteobacteria bacterium]